MAPDMNTLLPSPNHPSTNPSPTHHRPTHHSPRLPNSQQTRRYGSFSLPSATLESTSSSRRGSSVLNSPNLVPTTSAAGVGSGGGPYRHERHPSLGSLHQELEEEQEAQVNRLLGMIRRQQAQITEMRRERSESRESGGVRRESAAQETGVLGRAASRSTSRQARQAPPAPLSRAGSYRSAVSRASSPLWGERDEVAVMVAESEMVRRENAMLKGRIRELERLVIERGAGR